MPEYYLRMEHDAILKKKCHEVRGFSALDTLIESMYTIMHNHGGVGIAAPQVGDDRRVIIASVDSFPEIFVNPKIIHASGYTMFKEGCLSFPGFTRYVLRKNRIEVDYYTIDGQNIVQTFSGRTAVILQHEIDHLDGKTIKYH
jgi:peptide deformylase